MSVDNELISEYQCLTSILSFSAGGLVLSRYLTELPEGDGYLRSLFPSVPPSGNTNDDITSSSL